MKKKKQIFSLFHQMYKKDPSLYQDLMKLMLFLHKSILLPRKTDKNLSHLDQSIFLTRRLYKRK
jgi:hypothetical protein